jgi:hypothetical protein
MIEWSQMKRKPTMMLARDSALDQRTGSRHRRCELRRLPGARAALPLTLLAVLLLAGCDESFTPIEPTDLQFSIFGYLDASADTQWVRISPIRPVILTTPAPLGARVAVEQLGSGRTIELRDSVFRFDEHAAEVGSPGTFHNNYWTTERIEPGATYRFTATRDGVRTSEAIVEIPPDYRVEVWIAQALTRGGDLLRIEGAKHLAFASLATAFWDVCGTQSERRFFPVDPTVSDVRAIPITKQLFPGGCDLPVVEDRQLLLVNSAVPWPTGEGSGFGTGAMSNITGAVGFVGGVVTKRVPYEECEIEAWPPVVDYCRLRYDGSTATLRGTVVDAPCSEQGVGSSLIRMRELDPVIPGAPAIRTTLADRSGRFSIGALEPGRRYSLSVTRPRLEVESPLNFIPYLEHRDTLLFVAGEQRTDEIALQRLRGC